MKTINHQQLLRICASAILCSPPFSWLRELPIGPVLTKLSQGPSHQRMSQSLASALKAMSAGLSAVVHSATVNLRIYTGLVLIGIASPLSMRFYQLFDKTITIEAIEYHGNYYYLFHVLGPYFFMGFFVLGMYHLFPHGSKRSYILAMPLGYIIAKSILIILCTSNEEWHETVSLPMVAMGAGIALVLFVSIDWLAWRKYHKFDSIPARIEGIITMPGVDSDTKIRLIQGENRKLFTFHKDF